MRRNKLLCLLALLAAAAGLLAGCTASADPTASSAETVPAQGLRIYCFQAGKADAFLLWNEAGAVLIDTGESGFGKTVLAKLSELGIDRLAYLIVTHFDKDHVGGAKKILRSVPVEKVLQSNCPKEGADAYENYRTALEEESIEPVTVRQTLRFSLGDALFTVDPPAQERYEEDPSNNSSLIVTIACGQTLLLFLGDAKELRLREYLATEPGRFDFVKMPYHGRALESLPALLEQICPRFAVISSSDDEPEDALTLELLRKAGTRILLTREGPAELSTDGTELRVIG